MNLELEYCAVWNYEPQALSLTGQLLAAYKQQIQALKLVPSSGGCFEVRVNGDLIYSKLKAGKFPDEQWVLEAVGSRLKKR